MPVTGPEQSVTRLSQIADRTGVAAVFAALGPGEARLVGGAVRDALLDALVVDVDLATRLSPYEVMRRCGAAGIRTVPTGIAHGTVTALSDGETIEITTLRSDLATDGRHATVAFTDDWKEDAARRDFTVNALYFDPTSGELTDYFGGLDDLAARRIRFIGKPAERIAEDHLRILRFFRFTARFGKSCDAEGLAACAERANDLMALSRERIADEWLKLLGLPDPTFIVAQMLDSGILVPVLPEIAASALPRLTDLIEAERQARIAAASLRRFAALLPADSGIADRVAARLKLSNKARKRLASAVTPHSGTAPRALAYRIGIEQAQDQLLLAGDVAAARELEAWTVPHLAIGGGALIARGLKPGPVVASTLKAVEQRWIEEDFPSADRLEAIIEQVLRGQAQG